MLIDAGADLRGLHAARRPAQQLHLSARSNALSRWLTFERVVCSRRAAADRLPASTISTNSLSALRSMWGPQLVKAIRHSVDASQDCQSVAAR